jgi:hypothetical protein
MSRRRNNKSRKPEQKKAKKTAPRSGALEPVRRLHSNRERPEQPSAQSLWDATRIGVQGAGHPPADASFAERTAPYAQIVDAVLSAATAQLAGNVDVSFMKADFARLIAERMLVAGMTALLDRADDVRCDEMLDHLASMATARGVGRRHAIRGQPGSGGGSGPDRIVEFERPGHIDAAAVVRAVSGR